MSYQIGIDTIHLRPTPRLGHTEYCDHQPLIRQVTGDPHSAGAMFDPKFVEAWEIDLAWITDDGPFGNWDAHGRATNMGHAEYVAGGTDFVEPNTCPFTDVEQVYDFDATTEYPMASLEDTAAYYDQNHQRARQARGDCVCPGGYYKSIISGAIAAFGWDMLLLAAADQGRFATVLDSFYRRTLHHVKAWAQTSIEVFIQHDDFVWSAGAFMDPAFYRSVIIPRYAKMWRVLHDAGKKVLFCSDANWIEFLDDIVAAGADGFIFEPMMPLEPVVEKYGQTHVIAGSKVDCRTMAFGTIEQVRKEIDDTLAIAMDCPGFMFAVGNHIPANVPIDPLRGIHRSPASGLASATGNIPLTRGDDAPYHAPMPDPASPKTDGPATAIAPWCAMLDALQCGASLINRQGVIVYTNKRLCELMQREQAELIGTHVADQYTSPDTRNRIDQMLLRFDEASEAETYIERPDGTRLPVMSAARPLQSEAFDEPLRVVTITDITPLKEAMDDITELSDTVLEQAMDLKRQAEELEQRVRLRTRELHAANMDAIYMLAVASEARDGDTGAHVQRIQRYAEAVALEIGLPQTEAERIGYSAILHDVGKIQVPDHILKKPGKLTDDERAEMQQHTITGEAILSNQPFFELARQIARSHHENHDGTGYPDGLKAERIPLAARIVHVVDVFDALSSHRVYKDAWPPQKSADVIREGRGTQFDPQVVDGFLAIFERGGFETLREAAPAEDGQVDAAVIDSPSS
jgi:PAS domain S-box-containing protein